MPDRLPDVVDPISLAEKGAHLSGRLSLHKLDRLPDELTEREGDVSVDLLFGREGRKSCIRGEISAELKFLCQCCLEPMVLPVNCKVDLVVVRSLDEAKLLPESQEPLMLESGTEIALADIVQDELLLAVPVIPQHFDCSTYNKSVAAPKRPNPFSELARLKKPHTQEN